MKKQINKIIQIMLFGIISLSAAFSAEDKLAQTGFQFLSVTSDAAAGGMGEAVTTMSLNSRSLFFNPAGMAKQSHTFDVALSYNKWIAGIQHNTISTSIRPKGGRYGVFGFTLQSVDYGDDIQGTIVSDNEQGYLDTEIIVPTAIAIGMGYAKSLSDKFSVGLHIKHASQSLGRNEIPATDTTTVVVNNEATAVAFDFGTVYYTGWNDFSFGMSIRNFSQEIKYRTEGFQLPLTFTMGASIDLMGFMDKLEDRHALILSIDALHPRSFSERVNLGLEYRLMDFLILRSGYMYNYDERGISAGASVRKALGKVILEVDYAYTPFGVFNNVQRFSLNFAF